MDNTFRERLIAHSDHLKKVGKHCTTEETTKQALILPLLNILGFSAFDPTKVRAEYQADFPGVKLGERVDYALFSNNEPVMFIEAKSFNEKLDNHCPQLSRYFNSTPDVTISAITNGKEWRFFTDLKEKNIMDDEPFLTVNISNLTESDINQISKFRYGQFQADALRSMAEESIYLTSFTDTITASLRDVDLDFVRYVANRSNVQKQLNQRFLESISHIVKQAIQNSVSSMVVSGLSAPKVDETINKEKKEIEDTDTSIIDPDNDKIVTTIDERRLFDFVKSILPEDANIEAKDTESYFNILCNGKSTRWIVRYFDNRQNPAVMLPIKLDEADIQYIEKSGLTVNNGYLIIINSPENILRISGLIRDSYEYCTNDDNFKRKKSE